MLSHRTTARGIFFLLIGAVFTTAIQASPAAGARKVPTIVFPLIGDVAVDDNYGDPRVNGSHAGIDLMTPRRTPVVAAEEGRVEWWTTSARAGCMLYLYGASGTTYFYIHLNNDRTLRNDNGAGCVAGSTYTTKDGGRVTAGQQIAWSGDSGDANGNPHLHFEVHPNDGADVNPYRLLIQAVRHLFPARLGTTFTVGLRGTPLAGGGGSLTFRATSVRWWPGGRWTPVGDRVLDLALADDAKVDSDLAALLASPVSRTLSARSDAAYSVFTVPAKVTAAALRGEAGVLVATRVARPGAKLVATRRSTDPATPTVDDGTWTPPWEQDDPAAPDYPPRPY